MSDGSSPVTIARSAALALALASCGDGGGGVPADGSGDAPDGGDDAAGEEAWEPPPAATDWDRDIESTALVVDLAALTGTATIVLAPSDSLAASFDAKGIGVADVSCAGGPLDFAIADGRLDVGVPAWIREIVVGYSFEVQPGMAGLMAGGSTVTWPYHCGNLFPCHADPADGIAFDLLIENVPAGEVGVYPAEIPEEAPPYQVAWATGAYEYRTMGVTDAGTEIGFWFLPGGEIAGHTGAMYLVAAFDWYEKTYGPYMYGAKAGPVAVDWGGAAQGGMEHHPYWHVSTGAMIDKRVQVHEAAHGWFGDGVRIRCWEDFVLSEGTADYVSARAVGVAGGALAEQAVWDDYGARLDSIIAGADAVAWPDSCGEVDIIEDGLFSQVPYLKGAFFYRAVADEVGVDALDAALAAFYAANAGGAAGMQDMLDAILAETGFDPTPLSEAWLRSLGRP